MIEIELYDNVRQFTIIHLNYAIFLTLSIFLPINNHSIIIHIYI